MDKFIAEAGTSYFWLVQVVLATLVGLGAAYLKGPIDAIWGRFSQRRRARTARQRLRLDTEAEALAMAPHEVQFVIASEMRQYLVGLALMTISLALSTLPPTGQSAVAVVTRLVVAVASLATLVMGMALVMRGLDEAAKLRRAREMIHEAMEATATEANGQK